MKREIKFRQRIVNKEGNFKQFFYWGFIDHEFIEPAFQFSHKSTAEDSDSFTGLKDKNGVEIYEGDKVKIEYFKTTVEVNLGVSEIEAELTGVIEFSALALILKNIVGEKWSEYTGYDPHEGSCKIFHLHDVYEGSIDAEWQMEVIGNIYENPELL